jgi:hypothetical protein
MQEGYMDGLTIQNETVIRRLREIAEQQQRSIEEVLLGFIDQFQETNSETPTPTPANDRVRQLRLKGYARARRYWQQVGDTERAALTDEELDERFWMFDEEDIPRLKGDDARPNALMRLLELSQRSPIDLGDEDVSSDMYETLQDDYADYLLRRMEEQESDAGSQSD